MKDRKITIKTKPTLILCMSFLLLVIFQIVHFKFWYIMCLLFLAVLFLYIKTPNRLLICIYKDYLELYNEQNEASEKITFDQIIYWDYDNYINGNVTIVYSAEQGENMVCKIGGVNTYPVYLVLNYRLKEKNYRLSQYNAPFKKLGSVLHSKKNER